PTFCAWNVGHASLCPTYGVAQVTVNIGLPGVSQTYALDRRICMDTPHLLLVAALGWLALQAAAFVLDNLEGES
ncbi:MAG: hypothetical protein Q8O79_02865, partial [Pseudomonadota bacterium]|nr:hypothetical protein [Pseudomonadota bacterium]